MGTWRLRGRAVVEDNLSLVVIAFIVLTVVGGYVVYGTYVNPGESVQTEEVARWSSEGAFSHEATVVESTDVFDDGTVLQDRSAYFLGISPILDGSAIYRYGATEGGDLRVEGELTLELRAVSESTDGNVTEYWHVEETLGSATAESLSPGEQMRIPFSLNVSAVSQRIAAIEEQLGGTPGQTEIILRSRFDVEGTRNGRSVDTTRTYEATIATNGNVYSVEGDGPTTDSGRQMETMAVPTDYGPIRRVGGPLLLATGLLGLIGLAVGQRRGLTTLSDAERTSLDYLAARNEFDDWITSGWVPREGLDGTQVTVDSLEDLVDVAIDCDRRVIRDRKRDAYFVKVEDTVYKYTPPDEPAGPNRSPVSETSADS